MLRVEADDLLEVLKSPGEITLDRLEVAAQMEMRLGVADVRGDGALHLLFKQDELVGVVVGESKGFVQVGGPEAKLFRRTKNAGWPPLFHAAANV